MLYLWLGVAFDVVATLMMAISAGGSLQWDTPANILHTALALGAYFGMVAIAAAAPPMRADGAAARLLSKIALAPWALWVGVYVWGMVTRMPRRG